MNTQQYHAKVIPCISLIFFFFYSITYGLCYSYDESLFSPTKQFQTETFCDSTSRPFLCDGKMYLSISSETSTSLYTLQVDNTVSFNLVGTSPIDYNGIAFNATDQYIYAKGPYSHSFYQIGAGGSTTYKGQLDGLADGDWYIAADFTPEGYYVVTSNNGGDKIATYDITGASPSLMTINDKVYTDGNTGIGNFGDIAFHPITGTCYGYDHNTFKMCIINPFTGEITAFGNEQSSDIDAIGALFFNAKGELFAYGRDDFFQINLTSGEFTLVTNGPMSSTLDGCSCPYNLALTKSVDSFQDCSGETLIYTFEITNNSGKTQAGITFTDHLAEDFFFASEPDETFNGSIEGGAAIGSNRLQINDMSIPPGVSIFNIEVGIEGVNENSSVSNQATLSGFEAPLPFEIVSDDPTTYPFDDPTIALLSDIPSEISVSFPETHLTISYGDSILLNPEYNFYPDTVYWEGINLPSCPSSCSELWVMPQASGDYTVTALNEMGCMTSASLSLEVELDLDIYVPNAFSPNGDGINDVFTIYGKEGQFVVNNLQVFNRWGALLFQANDFTPHSDVGWDGTFKGQVMDPMVFIWYAEVEYVNGETEMLSGDLTLVK